MGLEKVDSKIVWILTEPEMDESLDWLINLGWLKALTLANKTLMDVQSAEKMAVWILMVSMKLRVDLMVLMSANKTQMVVQMEIQLD